VRQNGRSPPIIRVPLKITRAGARRVGAPPPPALKITFKFGAKTGAGEGIRTLDPDLGKVVLYP
jgi:hypothetical protein